MNFKSLRVLVLQTIIILQLFTLNVSAVLSEEPLPKKQSWLDSLSNYVPDNLRQIFSERRSMNISTNITTVECNTNYCQEAVHEITKSIDKSIQPCNNFYKFACGNFLSNSDIDRDLNIVGVFQNSQKKVDMRLEKLLVAPVELSDSSVTQRVKYFHQSCLKFTTAEGVEFLKSVLRNSGGFPALNSQWDGKNFSLVKAVETFLDYGLPAPFPAKVDLIQLDDEDQIFVLDFSGDPKYAEFSFFEEKLLDLELNKLLGLFNSTSPKMNAEVEKTRNTKIYLSQLKQSDNSDELRLTLSQLERDESWFPWKKFLSVHMKKHNVTSSFLYDTPIIFSKTNYSYEFFRILKDMTIEQQSDIFHFEALLPLLEYFPENVIDLGYGANKLYSQDQKCLRIVKERFQIALAFMYVNEYKLHENKMGIIEIAERIKEQYQKELEKVQYSQNTLRAVRGFLKTLKIIIGYEDDMLDCTKVAAYYAQFNLTDKNFLQIAAILSEVASRDYSREKNLWPKYQDLLNVGAFFLNTIVAIEIAVPMLDSPFYTKHYPHYLKYGRIGFILAHELAHGLLYNDLRGLPRTFENMRCIFEQYNNESTSRKQISGGITINEDMADNAGVQVAYRAYINLSTSPRFREIVGPDVQYSPEQLFWISLASGFCVEKRDSSYEDNSENRQHSVEEVRFNNAFANSEEFSTAFKCDIGSKMNPSHRCVGVR